MSDRPLNILVCLKFVIDPNQLQADPSGRPALDRAPYRINTFDENAIEAALQLASKAGGRAVGVSLMSEPPPKDVMLKALAMGLESLYLVRDPDRIGSDAFRIATVLAAAARRVAQAEGVEHWDLLLCGEASVDDYNGQIGPRLAAALDLPVITYATRIDLENGLVVADRGIEDRSETVEADLPALVTVGMEINDPRMPTVLQIMSAGRKPLRELALADLAGVELEWLSGRPSVRQVDVSAPPSARKNVIITGDSSAAIASELLRRLGADGEVTL